jgi:hypothetical protein
VVSGPAGYSRACEPTPTTVYAAGGRLIPFNSNSPIGSTFTAFSTFINTRGRTSGAAWTLVCAARRQPLGAANVNWCCLAISTNFGISGASGEIALLTSMKKCEAASGEVMVIISPPPWP